MRGVVRRPVSSGTTAESPAAPRGRARISSQGQCTMSMKGSTSRPPATATRPGLGPPVVSSVSESAPKVSTEREVAGEPWSAHFSPLYDDALRQHYTDGIAYSLKAKLIRNEVKVDDLLEPTFVEQGLKNLQLESFWQRGTGPSVAAKP